MLFMLVFGCFCGRLNHKDTMPELPPQPSILLESLRNMGYTLKSAIADIIDNSITANATCISIQYRGNYQGQPWLAICDNGEGMDREELFQSMKFGSRSYHRKRKGSNDLGRFGLGMKTASISQCRKLTVFSWQDGQVSAFCWDLDKIDERWHIEELTEPEIGNHSILNEIVKALKFNTNPHGTIVLWEKLDRDAAKKDKAFNACMNEAREHIALVFHRFMESEPEYKQVISFDMNTSVITPRAPFGPAKNPNRHILNHAQFTCNGYVVKYQPYLLPREVDSSPDEYALYAGREGYVQNQGFYVYRNRRLIERATWFKKHKKEHKTQLLRIRIDIPAELDEYWEIDVRKSQTTPPSEIQSRVSMIVEQAMDEARGFWDSSQRNVATRAHDFTPAWSITQSHPTHFDYSVNKEHAIYKHIASLLDREGKQLLRYYINLLAKSFPYERYYSDRCQNSDAKLIVDEENEEKEKSKLIELLIQTGMTEIEIEALIMNQEI